LSECTKVILTLPPLSPTPTPTLTPTNTPTPTLTPTMTQTSPTSSITGDICGNWESLMNPLGDGEWSNLASGTVNFSAKLQSGEFISTTEGFTSIELNSYTSIAGNTYDITGSLITVFNSDNNVEFNLDKYQNTDDTPVATLYFTGTIYTTLGRTLNINITSQYGTFTPGSPSGGVSVSQSCD
jgi:hypothetical protein